MEIQIKDDEVAYVIHALMKAISYVNNRLKSGLDASHSERRPTTWWDNFKADVEVAKILRALLDKLESKLENKEDGEQPTTTTTGT